LGQPRVGVWRDQFVCWRRMVAHGIWPWGEMQAVGAGSWQRHRPEV